MPFGKGFNSKKFGYVCAAWIEGKGSRVLPEYKNWNHMFSRCFNPKELAKRPNYIGCFVNDIWMDYQEFADFWHKDKFRQKGWHLDKDILVRDNKEYGPDTCAFVPYDLNCLLTSRKLARGKDLVGVFQRSDNHMFIAQCQDGSGKQVYLGQYKTAEEGFFIYKDFKESVIKERAEKWKSQISPFVYEALINWEIRITD